MGYDPAADPTEDGDVGKQLQSGDDQLGRQDAVQVKADASDKIAEQEQHEIAGDENPILQFEMHYAECVEHAARVDDAEQPARKRRQICGQGCCRERVRHMGTQLLQALEGQEVAQSIGHTDDADQYFQGCGGQMGHGHDAAQPADGGKARHNRRDGGDPAIPATPHSHDVHDEQERRSCGHGLERAEDQTQGREQKKPRADARARLFRKAERPCRQVKFSIPRLSCIPGGSAAPTNKKSPTELRLLCRAGDGSVYFSTKS